MKKAEEVKFSAKEVSILDEKVFLMEEDKDSAEEVAILDEVRLHSRSPFKRPLILVLDEASSHMDALIDAVTVTCGVGMVQIPPNASHFYQPLDLAVFRVEKTILEVQKYGFMLGTGKTALTKKEALQLASIAWRMSIEGKPENIAAGFEEAGIWPLSLPMMLRRLKKFKENGSNTQQPSPSWIITQKVVWSEILVSPPTSDKKGRRKTVDVKRRFFTQDDLRNE
uniref:AlNc14C102G6087 protein n=1 Tax=Albugo laibachii Nc14 TaxID=890382 RepID=F0WHK5_9STRA|nr:AlNc14C102G6087 [Albugo laibachii Nc14]|eukprot:CCA20743.1 AlNc14C102G6087 [Albugo laibachii Nc14]